MRYNAHVYAVSRGAQIQDTRSSWRQIFVRCRL